MEKRSFVYTSARALMIAFTLLASRSATASDIYVPAGGNLQAALDSAQPGDNILLQPGATYVGNFILPVHGGTTYVTLRTKGNDAVLPAAGNRITPAHAPYLAKLRAPDGMGALKTAPGAAYWRVMFVEFQASFNGQGDVIKLGETSTQTTLSSVPHHLTIDRVYIHGDPLVGQKRGIYMNSAHTTIINSHISDMKAVGQDSQAICGTNGPGPFRVENNHMEAAGEVFLMGGDDPKISNLVPSDLVFRRNTLTRPVSWRNPIVPAPTGVSASVGASGSLAAGTYGYKVVARRPAGTTTATSIASTQVNATVGAGGSVTIRWNPVANAAEYRVYGRGSTGQTIFWTVTTTSFVDTGAAGTSGTPPAAGTVWQVKNIFELKNARRVQVDYNVMENNWLAAQSGIAVLFSVRNQGGACTWCVVEDVVFEYNIVRNIGGGFSILGSDYNFPSQQANNIRISNNEISGLDKGLWGGNGYFLKMSRSPRDVVVDHNTIISPNGMGLVSVDGGTVTGFEYTNNVARHNTYGIQGSGHGYGNSAITYYFPNGVIRRNVFAGGSATLYPTDNFFPTVATFQAHFADYAGGDYSLKPGTDWAGAGTDSKDLGADSTQLDTTRGVGKTGPPTILTQSVPATTEMAPYAYTLQATGGTTPYSWSIASGALPSGVVLDSLTGTLSGTAAVAGDFAFTARVTDYQSATDSQALMLTVSPATPAVQIVTSAIPGATVGAVYNQHLDATGGSGSYSWQITAGQLPPGMTLSVAGDVSGTPTTSGSWTFTARATDTQDATNHASRAFTLPVAGAVGNQAPVVSVSVNASGRVQVGGPVTLNATASDPDGLVTKVTFSVDGQPVGSDSSAPFASTWVVSSSGSHTVTATATDDRGATATSAPVTLQATGEIVIYAADATRIVGDFQRVSDATAAAGQRLWNPNRFAAKLVTAAAAPVSYVEFTFYAQAGKPYRLWIRGQGEQNLWSNDSAHIQFSGSVDAAGVPVSRIGTIGSTWYSVEEYANAGLLRWGWQDNGFGLGVTGAPIYFQTSGLQTIRIQPREDGISIDQIVISPSLYLATAPGLPKDDRTIVKQ